eukprot:814961-Rhodomonas_salina.1
MVMHRTAKAVSVRCGIDAQDETRASSSADPAPACRRVALRTGSTTRAARRSPCPRPSPCAAPAATSPAAGAAATSAAPPPAPALPQLRAPPLRTPPRTQQARLRRESGDGRWEGKWCVGREQGQVRTCFLRCSATSKCLCPPLPRSELPLRMPALRVAPSQLLRVQRVASR